MHLESERGSRRAERGGGGAESENKTRAYRRERYAKGYAVNLSTSLPPFAARLPPRGFVGPEGPLVRTFAKLTAGTLSRRTFPSPFSACLPTGIIRSSRF